MSTHKYIYYKCVRCLSGGSRISGYGRRNNATSTIIVNYCKQGQRGGNIKYGLRYHYYMYIPQKYVNRYF